MTREQLIVAHAKATDWQEKETLRARLFQANLAIDHLAEIEPELAAYEKWYGHLTEWRQILTDQLLVGASNTRQALTWSIKRIDQDLDLLNEGYPALPLDDLMREAGYVPRDPVARAHGDAWLGSMPRVQLRLAELRKRRDEAQHELDLALGLNHAPTERDSVETV